MKAIICVFALCMCVSPAIANDGTYQPQNRMHYNEAYKEGFKDYYRNQREIPPVPPVPPIPAPGQGTAKGGYVQGVEDAIKYEQQQQRRTRPIPQ